MAPDISERSKAFFVSKFELIISRTSVLGFLKIISLSNKPMLFNASTKLGFIDRAKQYAAMASSNFPTSCNVAPKLL